MSRFQIIFMAVLVVFAVAGIAAFSLSKSTGSSNAPQVVMWGSLDQDLVGDVLSDASVDYKKEVNVRYVEKSAATMESELIAALARGQGPDLILLPQDLIVRQLDKFYQVSFDTYSERSFRDSFIEQGELYLVPGGIIGFPFSVDPIVMYWNRDLFASAGISTPPRSWTEFSTLVPKMVSRDANGSITQSLVSFGEVRNVNHAKDLVSLLALQAGTPIVSRSSNGSFRSVIDEKGDSLAPGEEAVRFYTEFSNPVKSLYSWNRSLPEARSAFVGGKLAIYLGYASELPGLRAANPNLNFDVARVPQTGSRTTTFGSMHAISILKASRNINAAYVAAGTLTSSPVIARWVAESGLPPVRRDLLASVPGDAYKAVFYDGALISRGWLDPGGEETDLVFQRMIENVTSGKLRISESVRAASLEIGALLRSSI